MAYLAEDDETLMQRMASNNPAMTMAAPSQMATRSDFSASRLGRSNTTATSQSLARRITSRSDPAGDGLSPITTGDSAEEGKSSPADADTDMSTSKYDVGWRRVVRNFSPSWFSVTMGTGICSLLLITIPWKAAWLYWLSVAFFILNSILFSLAFIISFLRYTLYPEIWHVMIKDPTMSLFLGTFPMGFATLVESWIFLCCPYWGYWSVWVAWLAWMLDVVIAVAVTVSLPFLLMSQSDNHGLERITAAQLLPIAATIVASGTGSEVAELLSSPDHAFGTILASYVLWGLATPLSMTVLVMYYQRLALHKLPPREVVVSSFLPIGPLGMGGYTIMYLGKVSREVFPRVELFHDLLIAGDIVYVLGVFIGLIMWGFGLCWLIFAVATIYSTRPFPFNMGWWGFTFPLGVYAISTMTFGVEFPSMFFKVFGTILSVAVILLWCVVATGTAKGAWSGDLFYAVCLKNLPPKRANGDGKTGATVVDKEKLPSS
ncbi:Sulfite efflux pump SSU1 [Cladophialophora carrionii]|uniref:Sulfite efflux pump SSU1 n=1 Tax=Cladophialophora carrionii TaxID=86049 RepID=A0A1C1CN34_9EURO|nr:Sulfite efflux pump SSU1 [Cladophialophora carrionii]